MACADDVVLRGDGQVFLIVAQWLARGGRAVHCNVCFFFIGPMFLFLVCVGRLPPVAAPESFCIWF